MGESQFQTPQKDREITANRRSKSASNLSKHRKSLNPSFAAISEEKASDFAKETSEFSSPISAVSVDTHVSESSENYVISPLDYAEASTSETIVTADQAPSSSSSPKSIITAERAASFFSVLKCENPELDSIKNTLPPEAEMVIKHLTAARIQVSKSEVEYNSRKLLDILLEAIIQEFRDGLYKERCLVDRLLTSKATLIFLSFMLGFLAVFVISFLGFGENRHPNRLTPT
ncbi:hypothetical protein F511_28585 [Dorcoceras hygrometricum]|uniref:Uncharacterized protein n=1 Tax=Dorcoceras hygrometricum TaxID=472368 RepID=A0A2Z7BQV3_9LAMI|nr:hypothetical protein F511_28585 [Dorcoceras hygrometricum]